MKDTAKKQSPNAVSAAENALHHLAFNYSLQPSIITTSSNGKIIIANSAACKLLGYSKKELLTKTRSDIFDIKETSLKKMLRQRAKEGHSIALVTAIKKNRKPVPCEITSAVFMDEDGVEKAITTIADMRQGIRKQKDIDTQKDKIVADDIAKAKAEQKEIDIKNKKIVTHDIVLAKSKQKIIDTKKEKRVSRDIVAAQVKSDARLAKNNAWIKYIAKTSYDVMWDWDIATGDIYVGDSIAEVFGCTVKNNTVSFTDFKGCLLPAERSKVEQKLFDALASGKIAWSDSYLLKLQDGSIVSTTSRASIVRDEEGKAIHLIGNIQDVSRLLELEKKLEQQIALQEQRSDKFLQAAKLSLDGIWDWNILTNEFFLGDGFEEIFGFPFNNTANAAFDWSNYLHPDDKAAVEKGLQDAITSSDSHWEHAYRFVKADGSIVNVFGRASIIRDADGKACRMIGVIHDISKQKALEERLEQEIKLKERQIAEAAAEAKETERANIGKELHDNVNQLLGASRLYLDMAKRGGIDSEMYLSRSSEYTLMAIEEIRKLTKGLTTEFITGIGLSESILNLSEDIMEVSPVKISCVMDRFSEDSVNHKFKHNIFRIVQEQLNNILKHAQATAAVIRLSQNKKSVTLVISDNGVGFNTQRKQDGIGMTNIKSRAEHYHGTAAVTSKPGKGCVLTIKFPFAGELLN